MVCSHKYQVYMLQLLVSYRYLFYFSLSLIMFYDMALCVFCSDGKCPDIVSRSDWGGRVPDNLFYMPGPASHVIIHHTRGDSCATQRQCTDILHSIQDFHMDNNGWYEPSYCESYCWYDSNNPGTAEGWILLADHPLTFTI